jgi:hypothetical protein
MRVARRRRLSARSASFSASASNAARSCSDTRPPRSQSAARIRVAISIGSAGGSVMLKPWPANGHSIHRTSRRRSVYPNRSRTMQDAPQAWRVRYREMSRRNSQPSRNRRCDAIPYRETLNFTILEGTSHREILCWHTNIFLVSPLRAMRMRNAPSSGKAGALAGGPTVLPENRRKFCSNVWGAVYAGAIR